jgi:hypothetical protein
VRGRRRRDKGDAVRLEHVVAGKLDHEVAGEAVRALNDYRPRAFAQERLKHFPEAGALADGVRAANRRTVERFDDLEAHPLRMGMNGGELPLVLSLSGLTFALLEVRRSATAFLTSLLTWPAPSLRRQDTSPVALSGRAGKRSRRRASETRALHEQRERERMPLIEGEKSPPWRARKADRPGAARSPGIDRGCAKNSARESMWLRRARLFAFFLALRGHRPRKMGAHGLCQSFRTARALKGHSQGGQSLGCDGRDDSRFRIWSASFLSNSAGEDTSSNVSSTARRRMISTAAVLIGATLFAARGRLKGMRAKGVFAHRFAHRAPDSA